MKEENKNTIASRKFRKKNGKVELKEVRGLIAHKSLHKAIKDKIRELFEI